MVQCDIYILKKGGTKWVDKNIRKTASGKEADAKHAERLAYVEASGADQDQVAYLFVQDEFPCEKCKDFFRNAKMPPCIFVCKGSATYAGAWGFNGAPPMPQVLYVSGTNLKIPGYVTTTQWVPGPNPNRPWEGQNQQITNIQAINSDQFEHPNWFPVHPAISSYLG